MQSDRSRTSNEHDWRYSYEWIERRRDAVTPRAYAGFLLTWASFSARHQRDAAAFPFLLREALRRGSPSATDLAVYFAVWAVPARARARLSRTLARSKRAS